MSSGPFNTQCRLFLETLRSKPDGLTALWELLRSKDDEIELNSRQLAQFVSELLYCGERSQGSCRLAARLYRELTRQLQARLAQPAEAAAVEERPPDLKGGRVEGTGVTEQWSAGIEHGVVGPPQQAVKAVRDRQPVERTAVVGLRQCFPGVVQGQCRNSRPVGNDGQTPAPPRRVPFAT